MFRRAANVRASCTFASRSIYAAEETCNPGNFFVSENRYFMANHQHFGGVEKKFVIHRASLRDMRTKKSDRTGKRVTEQREKEEENVETTETRSLVFFPQSSLLADSFVPSDIYTKCQSEKESLPVAIRSTTIGVRSDLVVARDDRQRVCPIAEE